MGKTLHLLLNEERRKALHNTERLDDFVYDLDLDGPTLEQTEEAQKEIEKDELEVELSEIYQHYMTQQKMKNYRSFLREVEDLGVSLKISKDFEKKNRLLKKYFGRRYESQGLGNYSADRLGRAFLGFLDYSRKTKEKSMNN